MMPKPSITYALTPNHTSIGMMSPDMLAEHYTQELRKHHQGEQFDESYGLELFRRTTVQHDTTAWEHLQHCLKTTMMQWLLLHPKRDLACSLDNQTNYIVQAYQMFWDRSLHLQQVEFSTLAEALKSLYICLNAVILNALRNHTQTTLISQSLYEMCKEKGENSIQAWGLLQEILPDTRELRLAYLLLHCGLKPREILSTCPEEFHDLTDIQRLHSTIIARILRSVAASNTSGNILLFFD